MWQAIYIAKKIQQAEKIKQLLEQEGFLVQINSNSIGFEIVVPSSEASEASDCLYDHQWFSKSG